MLPVAAGLRTLCSFKHTHTYAHTKFVSLPVESDRNEVSHTDPHCTLLLLLPVFFIQPIRGQGEWLDSKIRMETDADWFLYLAMRLYNSEVLVVVFTVTLQSAPERGRL